MDLHRGRVGLGITQLRNRVESVSAGEMDAGYERWKN